MAAYTIGRLTVIPKTAKGTVITYSIRASRGAVLQAAAQKKSRTVGKRYRLKVKNITTLIIQGFERNVKYEI